MASTGSLQEGGKDGEGREGEHERLRQTRGNEREINEQLDVDGLRRALPARIQKLVDAKGDRISN